MTLAGLARETSTIRLGTLMTAATFRLPGPLGVGAAQVDQMSGGRVELGIGTGWYEAEHRAYGIPFPSLGERFDVLTEQLAVLTAAWTTPVGSTFTHQGRHYSFVDSPGLPKPAHDPHPPIIIGGGGRRRTPALAATYAAECNVPFAPLDALETRLGRMDAACRTIRARSRVAAALHRAGAVRRSRRRRGGPPGRGHRA